MGVKKKYKNMLEKRKAISKGTKIEREKNKNGCLGDNLFNRYTSCLVVALMKSGVSLK